MIITIDFGSLVALGVIALFGSLWAICAAGDWVKSKCKSIYQRIKGELK